MNVTLPAIKRTFRKQNFGDHKECAFCRQHIRAGVLCCETEDGKFYHYGGNKLKVSCYHHASNPE